MKERTLLTVKIKLSLLSLVLASFFISCTNPSQVQISDAVTVKSTANMLEFKMKWTDELEGNILKDPVERTQEADSYVSITPYNINLLKSAHDASEIHPYVKGFATFDLSLYDSKQKELLEAFCTGIVENSDIDFLFVPEKLYELVVFRYELSQMNRKEFQWYRLGEPFVNEKWMQCPVRFYYSRQDAELRYDAGHLDVLVYLELSGSDWKISQICNMNDN